MLAVWRPDLIVCSLKHLRQKGGYWDQARLRLILDGSLLAHSHHGRSLLTLGDAEDLLIAAVLEFDAVPDVALLLAALGLLAVDDEPGGETVFADGRAARVAGEGGAGGEFASSRAGGSGLGKRPAQFLWEWGIGISEWEIGKWCWSFREWGMGNWDW